MQKIRQKFIHLSKVVLWLILSCSLLLALNAYQLNQDYQIHTVPVLSGALSQAEAEPLGLALSAEKPAASPAPLPATPRVYPVHRKPLARPARPSIWETMRQEFQLNTQPQSARVRAEIRKLLAEPNKLVSIFQAAMPYIYYIHQQTETRKLPAELALIPVIESEFNPNDKSSTGATGLWQLMRQTAHELGVKVQSGYDGRRNVVASTKAALAYFKDLGVLFRGNWYLAIAAYNCGQGRVESAIHRAGSRSFWNLRSLPRDTQYYVPRLLAVAEIIRHPAKYGVKLPKVEDKPYFEQITLPKSIGLAQVAKKTGASIETLKRLNPDFTRGSQPPRSKKNVTVLVPV